MQGEVAVAELLSIDVSLLDDSQRTEWKEFLERSNNGTVFHDLDFLAYHPADRFDTHNLMFRQNGELIALLPGYLARQNDSIWFKSPYGASVGGFVLPQGQLSLITRDLVRALKEYVSRLEASGIEMRIGPPQYCRIPDDHLGFVLAAEGFELSVRWLSYIIDLAVDPANPIAAFKKAKARDARVGLRKGLVPQLAGPERLNEFYRILVETQTKHNAKPTHTKNDLEDLFRRIPDRVQLYMCDKDGVAASGILVFVLNDVSAYTFYICQDDTYAAIRPTAVLMAYVAEELAKRKIRFLDLGPTSFEDYSVNAGLAVFKEDFGARGFCRDTWRWTRG